MTQGHLVSLRLSCHPVNHSQAVLGVLDNQNAEEEVEVLSPTEILNYPRRLPTTPVWKSGPFVHRSILHAI